MGRHKDGTGRNSESGVTYVVAYATKDAGAALTHEGLHPVSG